MLTTDGINFSAKSAKEAGTSLLDDMNEKLIKKIVSIIDFIFFILIFNIPNNQKPY